MNTPKFSPGQVVLVRESVMSGTAQRVCTLGMGAYDSTTEEYVWRGREDDTYTNSFYDSDITHVLNGGYWLPVASYNPPVVPDRVVSTELFDNMMEEDPDETECLKKNVKPRKIEVTDAKEE